jgi:hypothetical protein
MADWSTIASLSTAGGTLVLGAATFAAVRSANRAARVAERALQAGLRPVLFASRLEDPTEKVMWADRHFARVQGGHGTVEITDQVIYFAIALRNVGTGIAVLDAWFAWPDRDTAESTHRPVEAFRRLTRDLFVPPGGTGFWQGVIRDRDDPDWAPLVDAVARDQILLIDLLYGDLEGGQRTISRFSLTPIADGDWLAAVGRHWNLDRADPR